MKMSMVSNRVRIGLLFTLSIVVLLMLVMNHATPAIAQATGIVRVSNLDQPTRVLRTTLGSEQFYAQTFCTGSLATTLDKVRLYTLSNETDPNAIFYRSDPAPVVTIRSTDAWGKPGAVLHTLTSPVIDDSMDTAEDFTSSGYELAANTIYSVVIHKPAGSGHIGFLPTTSRSEDTDTQLGWAIGDQYMYHGSVRVGWTDKNHKGRVMKMAIYASGDLPSISTPAFIDTDCAGTVGPYEFSVDEMSAANTIVGVAVAGDADGDSMTYSVSGTDVAAFNNAFNLDASTGEITVKSSSEIDYENSQESYSITVSVTDGEDASGVAETEATIDDTTSVRIDVIDIDEPGTVTVSSTAPKVGGELTVSVTDPDDDTLLFTRVQWYRAANADADFIDIPIDPAHMANPSYTPTAADQSKYLKVTVFYVERSYGQVSSFDDRCRSEAEYTFDTLVANAQGLIVQSQRVNRPATGEPPITGTPRPGWTLSTHGRDIRDADGRSSALGFQWIRVDPLTGVEENVQNPESPRWWWTYVVQDADVGKAIKVRVSFTDDEGNAESVTSDGVPVTTLPLTATTHDVTVFHDGATAFTFELRFSEAPGGGFSATTLRDQALTVSGGSIDSVRQLETGKNLRWEITVQPSGNEDVIVSLLPTIDCADQGAICTGDGRTLSVALATFVLGPQNSAATGAPTIGGTAQVGETLTAATSGISDADGVANASFTYQWLADDTDISGATTSSYTLIAGDVGKAIKVTVSFTDDAGNAGTLTSAATAAVTLTGGTTNSLQRSNQEDVQENSAATGAPTIGGTAQVGESLTASTSDISDADGVANASFTYQWLADDADIGGATTSSYTLVAGDVGKAIKVKVSFTDDAGNEESVTSAATAAVPQPPLTATTHDAPESHDGVTAFTFELRFSEEPASGFGYTKVRDHAFTVTDGSVSNVRRLEAGKNVRWEITVTPDSDAEVTIAVNATTDCTAEGAICNADGGKLAGGLELIVPGPPSNSVATGAPTIGGTAQVGETLTASTSGISDADGLANASFTYQWLADDAEISGATGSSYTLVAADEGKAIKVTVSFTDDADNEESVTSVATTAVAKPPLTATVHNKPSSHDGSTAFTFELRLSEAPVDEFSYMTLQNHALAVTGGTGLKVRRLEAGKNVRWEITVTPSSNADVTIVLPITTDCSVQGAICTSDGRKLSSRVELTISGPGG